MIKFPPGGWECSKCFNYNFSSRWFCKRCKKTKTEEDREGMPKHLQQMQEQINSCAKAEVVPHANDVLTYLKDESELDETKVKSYQAKLDKFISKQNFLNEEEKRKKDKSENLKMKAEKFQRIAYKINKTISL